VISAKYNECLRTTSGDCFKRRVSLLKFDDHGGAQFTGVRAKRCGDTPLSLWVLRHYQRRLAARVRAVRERGSDIGSFLLEPYSVSGSS
jgi:hypothetical protein